MNETSSCGANQGSGSLHFHSHVHLERVAMPRAGSFSNLDDTEEVLQNFVRDESISDKIEELFSDDDHVASIAAEFLFEKAHSSQTKSEKNKIQMGRDGAIHALAELLNREDDNVRYHALSALSEIAFRNSWNCYAIAMRPGLLERLVELLGPEGAGLHDDAALVVNNCAAFCEQSVPRIVGCPGMLTALTSLAIEGEPASRNIAVGALNSFSRCEVCREVLLCPDVLEALWTALADDPQTPPPTNDPQTLADSGASALQTVAAAAAATTTTDDAESAAAAERREARGVRAAMALANLTGTSLPMSSAAHPACPHAAGDRYAAAAARAVRVLGDAEAGRSWAGVLFAPYSLLYPLARLARRPENHAVLCAAGLPARLASFIRRWEPAAAPAAERALGQALAAAAALAAGGEGPRRALRAAAASAALRRVALTGGVPEALAAEAERVAEELGEAGRAVGMAGHGRVGAESLLGGLNGDVLEMVARMAGVVEGGL